MADEFDGVFLITNVFRPYIVENLKLSSIFFHLLELMDNLGLDILAMQSMEKHKGAPAAMEAFLDKMAEKDLPGSYSIFINALRNAHDENIQHIADWIEGTNLEVENMAQQTYRYIVKVLAPKFKHMHTGELLHDLTCLGTQDRELIKADCDTKGECYAMITLMIILPRKGPGWFQELIQALKNTGSNELATQLEDLTSSSSSLNICEGVSESVSSDDEVQLIEEIKLRDYQKELSQNAIDGKNTVIVAPAGAGKTVVGVYIAKMHLDGGNGASNDKQRKVAFLVNKVPLVKQQQDQFKKYIDNKNIMGISGETGNMPVKEIKELLKERNVLVMTAQIMVNALDNTDNNAQKLDISDFTMIIMDECHRCQKGDPYNVIMSKYRDMKLDYPDTQRPQIIGLTAGLGVGQAQSTYNAESHILMLCANMDAQRISIVEKHLDDLNTFVNVPTEETILVSRINNDRFADEINEIMENIESIMMESDGGKCLKDTKRSDLTCPITRGTQPYEQWVVKMKDASAVIITDDDMRRVIVTCTNHLRAYTNALYINHSVRPKDALNHLQTFFDNEKNQQATFNETDVELFKFFTEREDKLKLIVEDPANSNPLLEKLGSTMCEAYKAKPDSCGILFTKTRASTDALKAWIEESEELQHLKPGILIGGGGSGGMTQTQQVDLLLMFKENKYKLIIATSVAEEGIDIQACNLVFRYNYFSNTIGRIQARGRNRAKDGRFFLIASADSGFGDQEEMNKVRESMMNIATKAIKELPEVDFLKQIEKYQRTDKAERQLKEMGKLSQMKIHTEDQVKLVCIKCGNVACTNNDIRRIKKAHYAVFDGILDGRYKTAPNEPKRINDHMEFMDKVQCSLCSHDWGTMLKYSGHAFPLLRISFFVVKFGKDKQAKYGKWSDVPFKVQDLSIEDLEKKINKEHMK